MVVIENKSKDRINVSILVIIVNIVQQIVT